MKILLITDAWKPQVNGVVTTLIELVSQLEAKGCAVEVIDPSQFRTISCPGYKGIDLAVRPYRALSQRLKQRREKPDYIHIATEGPLGWAARRYCIKHGLQFTSAFHTRFPELLHAALKIPLSWGYALFRYFHKASAGVMVPTAGVTQLLQSKGFKNLRPWTHGVDTELFAHAQTSQSFEGFKNLKHPIALCVGRISYEKNTEEFLKMEWHGSKVICGAGPLENALRARYPAVHWLGVLPRDQLAKVYASVDVFVMPSRYETFGLVMLEAMSCGTPVAAFPVDGPLEVMRADHHPPHRCTGGALNIDLAQAAHDALKISRHDVRKHALHFSWDKASELFVKNLVPCASSGKPVTKPS